MATKFTVDAREIEDFHHRFSKLTDEFPKEVERTTERAAKDLKSMIPPYPPKRPRQAYVRTGKLGRSFGVEVKPFGTRVEAHIFSKGVPYAPFVVDEKRQAWMHVGRWWSLQEVLSGNIDRVMAHFEGMFDKLWKKVYTGHRTYL